MISGTRLKLRYITQTKARPPTFTLFCNKGGKLPVDYQRYLTHALREEFDLGGVPIRLLLRKGENPYA
jgi:GTP-binding protein